jgi:hypothetical protein
VLPIAELIKELESGNTSLARCLSTQPGLSFDQQIDLALVDQKIRHGRRESYGLKFYTQTFPWLLSEPSQLYRLIKGELALSSEGETAFSLIERFAVDHPQVLPSTLEQLRSLARSDRDQTASSIDFDSLCDSLCDTFEELLKSGRPPRIELWLERVPSAHRKELFRNLVLIEVYYQSRSHRSVIDWQQYQKRFPEYRSLVDELKTDRELNAGFTFPANGNLNGSFISEKKVGDLRNGRYRLERVLGHGSYGDVYLAQDVDLRRQVAIKLPRKQALANLVNVESYLAEARNAASLDHPHIITVYDVGRTLDGSIYVVSRFIDGRPLDELIRDRLFDFRTAVQLLLQVSEALDHAHQRRLVHRDIKPANILVEEATGKPYIADFGLSIREEDYLQEGRIAGTPSYMSPEQVRGEGHRLDGRSDLFSLGVVMYQVLTGSLPFVGTTNALLEKQILHEDPPSLRYLKPAIPEEIERICLKLLRKRASERYSRGRDLADDLRNWLDPSSENRSLLKKSEVMPRGLRSFTAEDAGFFLDLLPGPRDRQGLPEAVAFWKNKIVESDADLTFAVGLLYGPSGSGKSSLVKAGLIPNLPEDVISIYVEATPDGTEDLLLRGLNKKVPATKSKASLTEALQFVRREQIVKVVIFIDQFEQWLHANPDVANASLSSALRQCDGSRLQCVVLTRDDFGMAAARFLDALDIPIVQGRNFAFTDLFDVNHAKKVLIKFGQAFGRLPLSAMQMGFDQQAFVEKLVIDLTQDGKVVPVRLSLLAEIIKDEPWTAETLKLFGGMEGLGVSFMEQAFGSRTANPTHRLHQQAARRVVSALLPENDGDIKACMRSYSDLLKISRYEEQPYEFDVLLRIMDSELRLITPTEPGGDRIGGGHTPDDRTDRYYQLTHDYLIPSLRRWLIQKQAETRKGQAEIKLAQSALSWNSNKDANLLPSLWDWFSIRRHTDNQRWTAAEWAMMHYATRYHAQRMVLIALCLTALFSLLAVFDSQWVGSKVRQAQVRALVDSLLVAEPGLVPDIIKKLGSVSKLLFEIRR